MVTYASTARTTTFKNKWKAGRIRNQSAVLNRGMLQEIHEINGRMTTFSKTQWFRSTANIFIFKKEGVDSCFTALLIICCNLMAVNGVDLKHWACCVHPRLFLGPSETSSEIQLSLFQNFPSPSFQDSFQDIIIIVQWWITTSMSYFPFFIAMFHSGLRSILH